MVAEFMLLNWFVASIMIAVAVAYIISMFGFIGNININTSGGGSVNISGADMEAEVADETTESIDISDANNLEINNPVGDVIIRTTNESKVIVNKKLYLPKTVTEDEKTRNLEIFRQSFLKQDGNKLELVIPRMTVMSVFSVRVDLEILVPKTFSVKTQPTVGNTQVEDVEGKVELQSNSGNIDLKRLKGSLNVHSNSGSITGHELSGISSMVANSGNITLSSVDIINSSSTILSQVGSVQVDINEVLPNADCEIKSNTGSVFVIINRQTNASFEALTSMGQLDIDPNIKVISKGQMFMGGSVVGVVNEVGGKLNIVSNTGSVKVSLK